MPTLLCMYICIYAYAYMYICTHIYTYTCIEYQKYIPYSKSISFSNYEF